MFVGGRHFGNGWPGTGGHPWARQGLVPGGVAAFSWASTLSVSAYWAHPAALARFPAGELAWMALSPLALAGLVGGAAALVRRTELSPRVLDFETRLGYAACGVMAVFLAGCCAWIVDGGRGTAEPVPRRGDRRGRGGRDDDRVRGRAAGRAGGAVRGGGRARVGTWRGAAGPTAGGSNAERRRGAGWTRRRVLGVGLGAVRRPWWPPGSPGSS